MYVKRGGNGEIKQLNRQNTGGNEGSGNPRL